MAPGPVSAAPSPVRRAARAVGVTFFVVGCLGFVPGATANLEQIHLTGPGSPTALLGVVPVTVAGNLVHLALAAWALLWCSGDSRARAYLVRGGALYAVLCARSIVIGTGSSAATPHGAAALWFALAAGVAIMTAGGLALAASGVAAPRPDSSGSRA